MSQQQIAEPMPPNDVDAEESVLGALLIDTEAIDQVMEYVRPEDFYREKNGWVYQACLSIADRLEPTDQVMVAHELAGQDRLEAVGGVAYLSQLVAMVPTSAHAVDYARIIHQCAQQRRLIQAGARITRLGYEGVDFPLALSRSFEELLAISAGDSGGGLRSLDEIAAEDEDATEEWLRNPGGLQGLSTGLVDVDRLLGGLKPGLLYVIAARPSLGKSMLALTVARNVARQGRAVGIFSLEMPARDDLRRLCLAIAGLNDFEIRTGNAPPGWEDAYLAARREVRKLDIYVDDTPDLATGVMRSRATRLRVKCANLGLLVVDYAQIAGDKGEEEVLRVGQITSRLKATARHLGLPMLMVSQLSREAEKRADKRPILSDLRASGQIEQDADAVLMLWSREYYHGQEPENHQFRLAPEDKNRLEVNVAKHRNGPTGILSLYYNRATGLIANWANPAGKGQGKWALKN